MYGGARYISYFLPSSYFSILSTFSSIGASWSPTLSVKFILANILELLGSPNLDNPIKPEIAEQYASQREVFNSTVAQYIRDFATSPA